MNELNLKFDEINYTFPLVFVQGTGDNHFPFGLENDLLGIRIKDFFYFQISRDTSFVEAYYG